MQRRGLLAAGLGGALVYGAATFSSAESLRPVTVLVQAGEQIKQWPVVLAKRLGYFADEGLDVQLQPVSPTLRTLHDVAALPATVFAGTFERTLYLNAQGKAHQAFVLMSRSPQVALGFSVSQLPPNATLADLVGGTVGVAASGSLGHRIAQLALLKSGLKLHDVHFVEMPEPEAALRAFYRGELEALSYTDPLITRLERMGGVRLMADTRTLRDTEALFGGPVACTCLSAPVEFIEREPQTVQALTHGIVRALKWLHTAGPQDLMRHMPEHWQFADLGVYIAAFNRSRETLAVDGTFAPQAARNMLRALDRLRLPLALEGVDPEACYTNRFAQRAKAKFRV